MAIPEEVIRRVVSHAMTSVINATKKHDSVEISGFGRIYFNNKKLTFVMNKYKAEINKCKKKLKIKRSTATLKRIQSLREGLEYLKKRYELE